jgi:alkanesulfonate monooxygenase SsuD/methylene tetrahydromethanopterin reductase-like flavin-dependent oxidoreductase (luciferase family)
MKYGLDVSTIGEYSDPRILADLAAEAEQAGWDGFFLWDVIFAERQPGTPVADPWITLAAIAVRTRRIRIGALLTPLARRQPWKVARETATLDHLSNGRLIFGACLGFQELEFAPFGQETDAKVRAEKLDEGLQVLVGLWGGEPYRFHGRHFHVEVEAFLPRPLQSPRIPVWIGGYWPNRKPFQRAARWDGVYPGTDRADGEPLTLADFEELVAYLKSNQPDCPAFDIAASGLTPPDPDKGAEIVRPYQEAGATWWMEIINDSVGPFSEMKKRIQGGPPQP